MNFFAHYYYYHKEGNPWYNAGLLFPDLLRIFTQKQRVSENKWIDQEEGLQGALSRGIRAHFKADEVFHNWAWFRDKNHEIALQIRESKTGLKRDWFIGHVLIELAIDHILVSGHESMVGELYDDLAFCDRTRWQQFFDAGEIAEFDRWYEGYSLFVGHRYIFTYKDTPNVVYALRRIYERTGAGTFDEVQSQFLLVLLNNFIPELKSKINDLQHILV